MPFPQLCKTAFKIGQFKLLLFVQYSSSGVRNRTTLRVTIFYYPQSVFHTCVYAAIMLPQFSFHLLTTITRFHSILSSCSYDFSRHLMFPVSVLIVTIFQNSSSTTLSLPYKFLWPRHRIPTTYFCSNESQGWVICFPATSSTATGLNSRLG